MRYLLLAGAAAFLLATAPAAAQQPTRPDTAARDTTARAKTAQDTTGPRLRVKPGTAFVRSLIIPGWGQASAGSYKRAAIFFTLSGVSDYMLVTTLRKLSTAEGVWNKNVADSVQAFLETADSAGKANFQKNPALWHATNDTLVSGWSLVRSRRKQREDRIFQSLFFTLVSGLDAFINAQLSDFPVGVEPQQGGGLLIHVDLPLGSRRTLR